MAGKLRHPLVYLALACAGTSAAAGDSVLPGLSPGTRELLRAEMRAVEAATTPLATAIVRGDWDKVAGGGRRIAASYILAQSLSDAQREELSRALPESFQRMDLEMHRNASKLADAATQRDPELAAYYFHRMLDGCLACHSAYAGARFPALRPAAGTDSHRH